MGRTKTIAGLLLVLLGLAFVTPAVAEFSVLKPGSTLKSKTMELSGQLDLGLSARVEEALGKGIPLVVDVELRLYRKRSVIWDTLIARWSFTHSIQYHALSRQYLVRGRGMDTNNVDSFTTLQEALNYMGSLDGLVLPLPQKLADLKQGAEGEEFKCQIRARLVIESLPAPLRPVAYTSADWRLNTGWISWTATR